MMGRLILFAWHRWLSAGMLLPVFLFASVALAQQAPGEPAAGQASADELEALVTTLGDEGERQKLIEQLNALIEARRGAAEAAPAPPQTLGAHLLSELVRQVDRVGAQFGDLADVIMNVPSVAAYVAEQARDPAERQRWLEILSKVALVLLAGLVSEWVVKRIFNRPRQLLDARVTSGYVARLLCQVGRTLLDVVAIAAFAAVAYGVLSVIEPRPITRLITIAIVNANVLVRVTMMVARLLFAPESANLRLARIADETAHYLVIWVRRIAVVTIWGYFLAEVAFLLGLPAGAHAIFAKAIGLFVAGMAVVFVMQNRAAVAAWLRGRSETAGGNSLRALRSLFAETWHVVAILFLVAAYAVWALDVEGGFAFLMRAATITLVVLVVARFAIVGLRATVRRGFSLPGDLKARFPALEQRANRYLAALQRFLEAVVYLIAGMALLHAWGIRVFDWLASDTGRFLVSRLATIGFIVLAALIVWEVVSTIVERYLEERDGNGGKVERSARLRTLLPLMRNVVRVVLAVIVTLTILSELGINIAPLLAGAGVVGLAVGFGAQSLVKDVITGTFILLEDAISVGDVVDLGGHAGVVESMNIRTIRLRDVGGNVHLVPFGEVAAVLNMTKDFSFAVIDVGIAYREDVDAVIEVLRQIGSEMQADTEFGPLILEPLEVLGLDSFGDSSVNIRVRFKTRPIKQWAVRREFHRRMKRVFDEQGIEIPFPHQTIYFGEDKEGRAPPAHFLVAQASQEKSAGGGEPPAVAAEKKAPAATSPSGGTTEPAAS